MIFPVLPSFRPYRDVEHGRRLPFYRALAPEGAIRDRCGFTQTVHRGGDVPQGHKPGKRSPPGGHLVPQGRKLGRDGISNRPHNAPSGAKHVPQGHKLGRNGVPDRPPMPLQGRNMSRRDNSSVGTAFTDGSQRPFRGKTSPPPPPIVPVQILEIDGLAQMPDLDVRAAVKVRDGAGHLQDVGR